MQLLVFTALAAVIFMISYALDLGGTISIMIALTVLLVGGTLRAFHPLVSWMRGDG